MRLGAGPRERVDVEGEASLPCESFSAVVDVLIAFGARASRLLVALDMRGMRGEWMDVSASCTDAMFDTDVDCCRDRLRTREGRGGDTCALRPARAGGESGVASTLGSAVKA